MVGEEQYDDAGLVTAHDALGEPAAPPEWMLRDWAADDGPEGSAVIAERLHPELTAAFSAWCHDGAGQGDAGHDHNEGSHDGCEDLGPLAPAAFLEELRDAAAARLVDRLVQLERAEAVRLAERAAIVKALVEISSGSEDDPFKAAYARSVAASVAASEVSAALKISARTARGIIKEGEVLTEPAVVPVLSALKEGRLSVRLTRTIMDAALPVPPERLEKFLSAAVRVACPVDPDRTPNPGLLARRLRRMVEGYTDEPLAARTKKAVADRRIDVEPGADGMCWLTAHLPLETGAAIDARVEALARSCQAPDEVRSLAQLRADVFADLLRDGTVEGGAPSGGVRCEVVLVIPAGTALRTSDTSAEILGYGPISPDAARLLAAQAATWSRLWVDPANGAPLAIGRSRYTPTAAMRRFLGARDAACRFRGCDRPAGFTEADHTREWADGGSTETDNLALLCREHHRLKSLGSWQVEQTTGVAARDSGDPTHHAVDKQPHESPSPPGTLRWTAPSGKTYITYPHSDAPPPF